MFSQSYPIYEDLCDSVASQLHSTVPLPSEIGVVLSLAQRSAPPHKVNEKLVKFQNVKVQKEYQSIFVTWVTL